MREVSAKLTEGEMFVFLSPTAFGGAPSSEGAIRTVK